MIKTFEQFDDLDFEEEIDEMNDWAIFKTAHGVKLYLTSLHTAMVGGYNKYNLFGGWDAVKYSNKGVKKFTLEEAKEIVDKNQDFYNRLGIVNSKGVQLKKGIFDNLWKRC